MLSSLLECVRFIAGPYDPLQFTVAHSCSTVVYVTIPVAVVTIRRATSCRPGRRKIGMTLTATAIVPMLVLVPVPRTYLF